MRCPATSGLLILLTAGCVGAQPDVSGILKKVNQLYKKLHSMN